MTGHTMRSGWLLAGTLAMVACDSAPPETPAPAAQPSPIASAPASTAPPSPAVAEVIAPTVYPPPVSGAFDEANVGSFDLVDGLAYPAPDGTGTLVYATSKSIASPVLGKSACPRVYAESLAHLRDAGFAEVTLDAAGKSPYFGFGHAYGGTGKSLSPNEWTTTLEATGGKVSGTARHKYYGEFTFDLPLGAAQPAAVDSEDPAANIAVYDRIRAAAKAGDLKAVLVAQGFDDAAIAAIRGLPGIDADLDTYATRFLDPGTPKEGSIHANGFYVDGKKSNGKAYWNYYGFKRCGDAIVLTRIHEDERD